jgi:hypothetical protein
VRISLSERGPGLEDLNAGYRLVRSDPNLALWEEEYRSHTQMFLFERGLSEWTMWRDMQSEPRPATARELSTVDVHSSWVAASAARQAGRLELATELLGAGVPARFGGHYDALFNAAHVVERSAIRLSRNELSVAVADVNSDAARTAILHDLADIADLVRSALHEIETLPTELQGLRRVVAARNALWIQLANALARQGVFEDAIALAQLAAESDRELFGEDDSEYADDATVVGQLIWSAGLNVQRSRLAEARPWLEAARKIYSTPGPHHNVQRLAEVDDYINDDRSYVTA